MSIDKDVLYECPKCGNTKFRVLDIDFFEDGYIITHLEDDLEEIKMKELTEEEKEVLLEAINCYLRSKKFYGTIEFNSIINKLGLD